MPSLAPVIKQRFFDENGDPLAGGKLYSYIAGTSTKRATMLDESGTSNTNPIILDANGECDIWLGTGSYKFALYDSDDVAQWTVDDVSAPTGADADLEQSTWTEHAVTDAQAATDLEDETLDLDDYSSAIYDIEILRGTTVHSIGQIFIQHLNGTGRIVTGSFASLEAHGVTFSVSQLGTLVQLRAALDTGAGNGTIKTSRKLIPA